MLMEVKDKPQKIVLFWICPEEAKNKHLSLWLKEQFAHWQGRKYTPVIMESGNRKLDDGMCMLLKHNREIIYGSQSKSCA